MTRIDLNVLFEQAKSRHIVGDEFLLSEEETVPAIWGDGDSILWADGEGLMIAGGVGAGKSTILQQLILHGIGAKPGPFLGYDVNFPEGVVAYVAADRPSQIRRSMRRMVTESDRALLNTRLDFWRGPLPFDLSTAGVGELADFVEKHGWAVLAIDSLKDVTGGMSTDEDGAAINRQFQELLVRGVQLVVNHHDRKGENRSKVLDDVYGSRWLTAGFGSVLYVQGDAGSEVVEFRHLKQPADVVGPFTLRHDHTAGVTVVEGIVQIKKVRTPGAGKAEVLAFVASATTPHTAVDISNAIGVTRELAGRWLRELERVGQVKRDLGVGTGHADTWRLP